MRSWFRRWVVGHSMVIALAGIGGTSGEIVVAATPNEDVVRPHWLSAGGPPVPHRLAKGFQVGSAVQSGSLKFAADFCRARVEINGEPILVVEPYTQTDSVDVTNWLRQGANTIEIVVEQLSDGPAVVAATLVTELVDKSSKRGVSMISPPPVREAGDRKREAERSLSLTGHSRTQDTPGSPKPARSIPASRTKELVRQ